MGTFPYLEASGETDAIFAFRCYLLNLDVQANPYPLSSNFLAIVANYFAASILGTPLKKWNL